MLGNKKIRRPVKAVAVSGQRNLELFGEAADQPLRRPVTAARFVDPDPRAIRIGDRRLDEHLQAMGLRDGLRLRQLLSDLECMWVSGGIGPDHSILGRFIMHHGPSPHRAAYAGAGHQGGAASGDAAAAGQTTLCPAQSHGRAGVLHAA